MRRFVMLVASPLLRALAGDSSLSGVWQKYTPLMYPGGPLPHVRRNTYVTN